MPGCFTHVVSTFVLHFPSIANVDGQIYLYIYISRRIFENIPQNGPEYSHRNLAIAGFLVTVVRKNIGALLSWLVSLSSMSIPSGGRVLQKRGTVLSLALGESVDWSCLPLFCHVKFF